MARYYIAAPYSHIDIKVRMHRAEVADLLAATLLLEGHVVYSPLSHSHMMSEMWGLPMNFEAYRKQDSAFLYESTVIYVITLSGWQESHGVAEELALVAEFNANDNGGREIRYISEEEIIRRAWQAGISQQGKWVFREY